MQPDVTQAAGHGKSSSSPAAPCDKSDGVQALVGLQSYGSDTDSNSSGSGDNASHIKHETLGPFF